MCKSKKSIDFFPSPTGRLVVRGRDEVNVGDVDNQQQVSETHLAVGFGPEGADRPAAHQRALVLRLVARPAAGRVAAGANAVALEAPKHPRRVVHHVGALPVYKHIFITVF